MDLVIENLTDGVRYILPRRRRSGLGRPLLLGGLILVAGLVAFVFLVRASLSERDSINLFRIALGIVQGLAAVVLGWFLFRGALALFLLPDTEIELAGLRIVTRKYFLGRGRRQELYADQIKEFVLVAALDETDDETDNPGELAISLLYGLLVAEGPQRGPVILAQAYGLEYLARLAEDLAGRLRQKGIRVPIRWESPELDLEHPGDHAASELPVGSDVKSHEIDGGMAITIPPAPRAVRKAVIEALVAGFVLLGMGVACATFPLWMKTILPSRAWAPIALGVFIILAGLAVLKYCFTLVRIGRRLTLIEVAHESLAVTFRTGNRLTKQEWGPGEVVAIVVDWRALGSDSVPVYELAIFDLSLGITRVLRGRSLEELEWIEAAVQQALGLKPVS